MVRVNMETNFVDDHMDTPELFEFKSGEPLTGVGTF